MSDTHPGWALRPAEGGDAAFLASLFRSTRPELAMLPDSLADMLIKQQQQLQEIGYRQQFPSARSLVIEADGQPAGRLVLDEQAGLLRVIDIAVLPAWRGHGIATAVLKRVQRDASDSHRDVVLSVAHDNHAAKRLYACLGFVEEGGDAVRAAMRWRAVQ